LTWLADGQDFSLFEAVWEDSRPAPDTGSLAFALDTTAFRDADSGSKIGLGSSAALTAALATALHALGGATVAEAAHAAHRRFQGGSGSGVDIACSLAGGVIEYHMADQASKPLVWPGSLHCSVLWSGVSAGTVGRIAHFRGQPQSRARSDLGKASMSVARDFGTGDAHRILAGLGDYTQALRQFDAAHGLGIFDAGHAALAERAADEGVVYKPCGAGGGDIGVAVATSTASLASFEKLAERSGFKRLALNIDPRGAMLLGKDEL
jgi:phosphomevalonate kinase